MALKEDIEAMLERQLRNWNLARDNYNSVRSAKRVVLTGDSGDTFVELRFIPERMRSTAARIDTESLKRRKCFLCLANQPQEQETIEWNGRYKIQVNPYPIFSRHFTIAALEHVPQRIEGRVGDMLALADELPGYVVFYNGPESGASAPDHFHFQAGLRKELPVCEQIGQCGERHNAGLHLDDFGRAMYYFKCVDKGDAQNRLTELQGILPAGEYEPKQNVLCWTDAGKHHYHLLVFPRYRHRPSCYGDGDGQIMWSPASVDLAGLIVLPREADFRSITIDDVIKVFCEVTRNEDDCALTLETFLKEKEKIFQR